MEKSQYKSKRPLKLVTVRNKIIAVVIGIILVFAPFIFIYFPSKQKDLLVESYNKEVKNIASTVALGVNVALIEQNFSGVEMAMQYAKSDERLTFIALVQIDTLEAAPGKNPELKKTAFSTYPENYKLNLDIQSSEDIIVKESEIKSEVLNGKVMVGFSTKTIQENIQRVKITSFIGSFLVSLLSIIIGYVLARNISKPILKLRAAHLKVGEGDLQQNVIVKSRDEIGDLASSFNQMVKQLDKAEKLLQLQKNRLEEKNKEMIDSISYSKRIQYSLLVKEDVLKKKFPDHFIFFQPKDIVSGDFYWGTELNNGQFALVIADSTGHGVPGAIMSMLNISCLNEAVVSLRLTSPSDILTYTRSKVINHLSQDGSSEGGQDGMDCCLMCFDFKNNVLIYAAANNPIWIVRKKEIIELVPDKMPVGKHQKDSIPFKQHSINLQKGDMVYAFTDGIADQFGGPNGKKFKYKQLKELLINVGDKPMSEQKSVLQETINAWKGDLEQVDDICLMGVRI
ncbi:MAG: SpoIIE family protein phosphatase [Bacteroidia bacterium]|nr:SpoIIE family protein phosphatase [Bacteroidia bacterium]